MFVFYDWPFPHVYFAKNVAYFSFNSWLSFQRLCRLLWGFDFNRNHASILYRFRDTAGYLSKIADFDPPSLHLAPP